MITSLIILTITSLDHKSGNTYYIPTCTNHKIQSIHHQLLHHLLPKSHVLGWILNKSSQSKIITSLSSLSILLWPKPRFIGQFRWAGSDSVNIHKYWLCTRLVNQSDRQSACQHLDDSVGPMIRE